jgi:hypothetical protein
MIHETSETKKSKKLIEYSNFCEKYLNHIEFFNMNDKPINIKNEIFLWNFGQIKSIVINDEIVQIISTKFDKFQPIIRFHKTNIKQNDLLLILFALIRFRDIKKDAFSELKELTIQSNQSMSKNKLERLKKSLQLPIDANIIPLEPTSLYEE